MGYKTAISVSFAIIKEDVFFNNDDDDGGVAAPQARFLFTFVYQTTPMFLMTLHSFLPSYFSHFVHFSIHTKSLH